MNITYKTPGQYKTEKKSAFIYNLLFAKVIIIGALIAFSLFQYNEGHASRLESVCQKSFIGYEYKTSLERRCRPYWNLWTFQIKQSFNQK